MQGSCCASLRTPRAARSLPAIMQSPVSAASRRWTPFYRRTFYRRTMISRKAISSALWSGGHSSRMRIRVTSCCRACVSSPASSISKPIFGFRNNLLAQFCAATRTPFLISIRRYLYEDSSSRPCLCSPANRSAGIRGKHQRLLRCLSLLRRQQLLPITAKGSGFIPEPSLL